MNTPENLLAFRQACQRANIRTIGCEFDGSGDEGYVNMVGVLEITLNGETTTVSAQSLDDLKDSIPIIGLMSRQRYNYANNSWDTCAEAERLHDLATTHSVNLDSVFYNVLHNFPGDWINNSGGYGQAYLDLVTGQYDILGYQRYESQDEACAEGTFFDITIANPVDDTADYIKTLLQ